MLMDMIRRHFVTIFLIILFSIILWPRKKFKNTDNRFFWITVISCFILVLEDILETIASKDPSMRFFRILFSVIGYNFRTNAVLGLLFVIVKPEKRKPYLWIPAIINLLVCCTAFFSGVAFGYDENYTFYRGPLGYIVFIVPVLYLLVLLWTTFRRFSKRNGIERFVPLVCAVFCLIAAYMDTVRGGTSLNEAIMISSIFFYIVLYSQDNRRDTLTGLLNRKAFYDDCTTYDRNVYAVASIDMNGLKTLNDTKGHNEGDRALSKIGECIGELINRTSMAYRIGGDEFVILFFSDMEDEIIKVEQRIKESVTKCGYSVSVGHSLRESNMELEETIKRSDKRMYEDKAKYYSTSGVDRRKGH